jgi:hypothetical protein
VAQVAVAAAAAVGADTAWLLTSTALVLFMSIPGLSLFYAGLVRSKNALSVLVHCFALVASGTLTWLAAGYSLAFSAGGPFVGGLSKAFLAGVGPAALSGTVPELLFFLFQGTFAIITPALMVGAFVERMKLSAVLLFCTLWSLLVYAPVCHWVWGGGWLAQAGVVIDGATPEFAMTAAYIIFDTRMDIPEALMSPLDLGAEEMRGARLRTLPPEFFMLVRTVTLIRGILSLFQADVSASLVWEPYARAALKRAGIEPPAPPPPPPASGQPAADGGGIYAKMTRCVRMGRGQAATR